MPIPFTLLRPFIHALAPETAHNLGLFALTHGLLPAPRPMHFPELEMTLWGLNFPNPIGLAAGFDKNAVAIDALLDQGFGFVEAGTVTPLAQAGNPKPRVFRLGEDRAIINRLGFNNHGLEAFGKNFKARDQSKGVAGANIGKNKNAADANADYVTGLRAVHSYADYVTINISSPNTQGLRALQERDALTALLSALQTARAELQKPLPLLLKIAPDLAPADLETIAEITLAQGIDGVIISNTTIGRPPSLQHARAHETGGLSGAPLFSLSTQRLKYFYRLTEGKLPLIGVGGIASARDAYLKIRAGASLVQLYTALAFEGFSLVREMQSQLVQLLTQDGFTHISQAIGVDAKP